MSGTHDEERMHGEFYPHRTYWKNEENCKNRQKQEKSGKESMQIIILILGKMSSKMSIPYFKVQKSFLNQKPTQISTLFGFFFICI